MIVRIYRLTRQHVTVGVNGVLVNDQHQIFLVEHVFHPHLPWGLPGGWVERREEPYETIVREFEEETQLQVRVERPLLVRKKGTFRGNHVDISYLLRLTTADDTVKLSGELLSYGWFALDNLPPLNDFNRDVVQVLRKELINGD